MRQAEWWARKSEEEKRAVIARRDKERERARDREREADPRRQMMKRARTAVSNAIRDGRLVRGECEQEGECGGRVEGHHDDYSRPLDVRWLCKRHHDQLHQEGIEDDD